jgi:hypothetical protein
MSWPQVVILLVSASQIARITSVSHWHLAYSFNNFASQIKAGIIEFHVAGQEEIQRPCQGHLVGEEDCN